MILHKEVVLVLFAFHSQVQDPHQKNHLNHSQVQDPHQKNHLNHNLEYLHLQ